MKIVPLDHSGVLVITARRAFLFDYIGGELPDFSMPLTVLVSHRHEDHFDPKIFTLGADEIILSSDIKENHNHISIAPYEMRTHEDYTLKTVASTDEGVAFLLETEGVRLFFAADLNDWYWEDEDTHEDMVAMERAFRHEIDLVGDCDVLFFPVDVRLRGAMTKGLAYAVKKLNPKSVMPIHTWKNDAISEQAIVDLGRHVLTRDQIHTFRSKHTSHKKKTLVTGFEPFGGEVENPSEMIINVLKKEHDELITMILPVSFERAQNAVRQQIHMHRPDRFILLGQAGGRNRITLEMVAVNFCDAGMPDNDGKKPWRESILKDAPDAYLSTAPVHALVDRLRASDIPAAVSMTAGTYVCNAVYFSALHAMNGHGETVFVHLPYLPTQVTEKDMPSMDLSTMRRAIEELLR